MNRKTGSDLPTDDLGRGLGEALRESENDIDFVARSRLQAARARAVEAAAVRRSPLGMRLWAWGGLSGAVAVAAIAWLVGFHATPVAATKEDDAAQAEMIQFLGSDDAPVLEEDPAVIEYLEQGHGKS